MRFKPNARKTDRKQQRQRSRDAGPRRVSGDKLEDIDYKNLALLQKLVSGQGKHLSRKRTGYNAMQQRAAQRAIKRARFLALLPFCG